MERWSYSFKNLKGVAKEFYLDTGKPYSVGSIFRSPGQAEVLKKQKLTFDQELAKSQPFELFR